MVLVHLNAITREFLILSGSDFMQQKGLEYVLPSLWYRGRFWTELGLIA
jgi:hypothetical protein